MKKNTQLRQHMPLKIISWLINRYYKVRGLNIHSSAIIFSGAKIMRYIANISISSGAIIKSKSQVCACNKLAEIYIGSNTTIGNYTFIYASEKIKIGKDCMLAPFVYIVDSDHGKEMGKTMNAQSNITSPIIIEDDVWIGSHSVILPGVRIGKGSVIAAGSVVNKNVKEYSIYGGVPAKFLKDR